MPNDIKRSKIRDISSSDLASRGRQAASDSITFYVWVMGGLIFAGCSGGSSSGGTTFRPFEVTVQGIEGARLYSGSISAENQIGITDSNGEAVISGRHASEPIIVSVQGATYLGNPITGNSSSLTYEALSFDTGEDGSVFISPLTDFLVEGMRAGTSPQAQLDAIFGEGRVSLSDVVNSDNYFQGRDSASQDEIIGSDLTNSLVHQLVSRASVAAFVLQTNPRIGGNIPQYEKMQDLFAYFRTEDASVGGVNIDNFALTLNAGDLANEVIRLLYDNPFTGENLGSVMEDSASATTDMGSVELIGYQASYVLRYDPDTSETTTAPVDLGTSGMARGKYGELALTRTAADSATITWEYTINNVAAQELRAGQTYTEIFNIFVGPDANSLRSGVIIVYVEGTNDPLMSGTAIGAQVATLGATFTLNLNDFENAFTDADKDDPRTYSADPNNPLPDWLSLSTDGVFSGVAEEDGTPQTIHFMAQDRGGSAPVASSFTLSFNNPPTANVAIEANHEATVSAGWSFTIGTDAFEDLDGDTLTYSAAINGAAFPGWLMFDENTGAFTIAPNAGVGGEYEIIVSASDGVAGSVPAGQRFTLTIIDDVIVTGSAFSNPQEATHDGNNNYLASMTEDDADYRGSAQFSDTELANSALAIQAGGRDITMTGTAEERTVMGTYGNFVFTRNDETGTLSWVYTLTESGRMMAEALTGGMLTEPAVVLTVGEDAQNPEDTKSLVLTITGVDDTTERSVATSIAPPDLSVDEDAVANFGFPADAFTDTDSTLTYAAEIRATGSMDWMNIGPTPTNEVRFTFDPTNRAFGGTPNNDDAIIGTYTIRITATGDGAPVSDAFTLRVNNTNDAPISPTQLTGDFTYTATQGMAWDAPVGELFQDIDPTNDTLSFGARFVISPGNLRHLQPTDWVNFDPNTGRFYGTPTNDAVGTTTLQIRVSDDHGALVTRNVVITTSNVNDAPTPTTAIGTRSITANQVLTIDLRSAFRDVDIIHGDSLSYSATVNGSDASWITFSGDTMSLAPQAAHVVSGASVVVTATDRSNQTTTSTFMLTVTTDPNSLIMAGALSVSESAAAGSDVGVITFSGGVPTSISVLDTNGNTSTLFELSALASGTATLRTSATFNHEATAEHTVRIRADYGGNSVTRDFTVTIADSNEIPSVTNAAGLVDQTHTITGSSFDIAVPANLFSDPDEATEPFGMLTLSATVGGSAAVARSAVSSTNPIGFDSTGNGALVVARDAPAGAYAIVITATDGGSLTATHSFTLTLNTPPEAGAGEVQGDIVTFITGRDNTFTLRADVFHDPDGDNFDLSVSGLPSGVTWNENTRTISGTPAAAGTHTVSVSATDVRGGVFAPQNFTLDVQANANPGRGDLPTAQTVVVGETWIYDFTNTDFADTNGDSLANSTLRIDRIGVVGLTGHATLNSDTFWIHSQVGDTTHTHVASNHFWLDFDASLGDYGRLTGTAVAGNFRLHVEVIDDSNGAVGIITNITVDASTTLGASTLPIEPPNFVSGRAVEFYIPDGSFFNDDSVTLSAEVDISGTWTPVDLMDRTHGWYFNATATDDGDVGRLYSTRTETADATASFRITATHATDSPAQRTFDVSVVANSTPTLTANTSVTRSVIAGEVFTFDASTLFADADIAKEHGDTLTYEVEYRSASGGIYASNSNVTLSNGVVSVAGSLLGSGASPQLRIRAEDESEANSPWHEITFEITTLPTLNIRIPTEATFIAMRENEFYVPADAFTNLGSAVLGAQIYSPLTGWDNVATTEVSGQFAFNPTATDSDGNVGRLYGTFASAGETYVRFVAILGDRVVAQTDNMLVSVEANRTPTLINANIETQYVGIGETAFSFVIQDLDHVAALFADLDGDNFADGTMSVARVTEVYTGISGSPTREIWDVDTIDSPGATAGPSWLEYDEASRTIRNIASTAASGTNDFTLRVLLRDASNAELTVDIPISVAAAPVASTIPNMEVDVNQNFSIPNLATYFTDADTSTLFYSVSGADWLSIMGARLWTPDGTPAIAGEHEITVTARDVSATEGREASTTFTLDVQATLAKGTDIETQTFVTAREESFYVPANAFTRDENEALVFSAQVFNGLSWLQSQNIDEMGTVPGWSFDPDADDGNGNIGRLYATRTDATNTDFTFRIGATPEAGGETVYSNDFTLKVDVNEPLTELSTPSFTSFVGIASTFSIPDVGEEGAFLSDAEDTFANGGIEVKRLVIVYQPRVAGHDEIELHDSREGEVLDGAGTRVVGRAGEHSYNADTRIYTVTATDTTPFLFHLFISDGSGSFLGYNIDITPAHAVESLTDTEAPTIYAIRTADGSVAVSYTIPDTDAMGALFADLAGDSFAADTLEVIRVEVSYQGAGMGSNEASEIFDSDDDDLREGSSIGARASWSSYDEETRTFSIMPNAAETGAELHITVKDKDGAEAIATLPIDIGEAPTVSDIANQVGYEGLLYELDLDDHFSDGDTSRLYYSVTLSNGDPLPPWLAFNGINILSGRPGAGDVGDSYSIKVVARDLITQGQGRTAEEEFGLSVIALTSGNSAPIPISEPNPFASIPMYEIITGEAYQVGDQEVAVGEAVVHVKGGVDAWRVDLPLAFTDVQGHAIIESMRYFDGTAVPGGTSLPFTGSHVRFVNSGNGALIGRSLETGIAGRFILEAGDDANPQTKTDYILAPQTYTFAVVAHVDTPPARVENVFENQSFKQRTDGSLWEYDLPQAFTDEGDLGDDFTLSMRFLNGTPVPIGEFDDGLPLNEEEERVKIAFDPDGGDGYGTLFGTRDAYTGVAGRFILTATEPFDSDPADLFMDNEVDYLNGTHADYSFLVEIVENNAPQAIAGAYEEKVSYFENSLHEWRYDLPVGFIEPDGDPFTLSAAGAMTGKAIPLAVNGERPMAPPGTPAAEIEPGTGKSLIAFDPTGGIHGAGQMIGFHDNNLLPFGPVDTGIVTNFVVTARDAGPDGEVGTSDDGVAEQAPVAVEIKQNLPPFVNVAAVQAEFTPARYGSTAAVSVEGNEVNVSFHVTNETHESIPIYQHFFGDNNNNPGEHQGNLGLAVHIPRLTFDVGQQEFSWAGWAPAGDHKSGIIHGRPDTANFWPLTQYGNYTNGHDYTGNDYRITIIAHDGHGLQSNPLKFNLHISTNSRLRSEPIEDPYGYIEDEPLPESLPAPLDFDVI